MSGVRQNNLKNINVEIPLGSFTVICGPSGSGKSSLAFETLYAEGQRRYIESLSNYARQFLNKAPQPDLDSVENVPPAIAIEQKNQVKTSRSTVGTLTELTDYLRLLFDKLATPYCPNHHTPIERESVTDGTKKMLKDLAGHRGYILAPVLKDGRVAEGKKLLQFLMKEGHLRIFAKGEVVDVTSSTTLPSNDFEIVIDRVAIREEDQGRLSDSLAQAYAASKKLNTNLQGGRARILSQSGTELRLSEENSCSICGFTFPPMTSRLFSFSSPVGACSTCKGFGNTLEIDVNKVIPNPELSIAKGALTPFEMPSARADKKELLLCCARNKIDIAKPWSKLKPEQQAILWEGNKQFYGVKGLFDYLETKKYKMHVRVFLSRYKTASICKECQGTRLRSEIRHILLQGKSIIDASAMTIDDLRTFLRSLNLTSAQKKVSQEILKQLLSRLDFLIEVGVNYLTLDRQTRTLSGGEYQRLNLANQLGMGLSQILYVLDEPTVGLHPRDNDRLIGILKKLKTLGNTLVVVEHDHDVIKNSERIIEIGPGSGSFGGDLVFTGTTADFLKSETSPTAPFLRESGKKAILEVRPVDLAQFKYKIDLHGCRGHNLKNVSVTFPLHRLVAVTGVSGSGKSSLVSQTLVPAIQKILTGEFHEGLPFEKIEGFEHIKNLVFVDQNAVGRSARSNPVTYLKVFDDIRNLMASAPLSKERGYTPGHFSLNVDGGRCPVCKGEGAETVDMVFMDDVKLVCEECRGKKFRDEVLEVQFQGKTIDDILNLTVADALVFFQNYPGIRRALNFLKEVGLDYVRLGQSSSTLSGGESQRLKLAKEFASAQQRGVLYILDEPTTGLHFKEVNMLLNVLNKLIEAGGSVIVIEHNLDVIRSADFVIELGPDGGHAGGDVIFQGPPQNMILDKYHGICPTAPYLKRYFGRKELPQVSP